MTKLFSFLMLFAVIGDVTAVSAMSLVAPPCGPAPLPVSSTATLAPGATRTSATDEFIQAQLQRMETHPHHYDKRCFDNELAVNPAGNVAILPMLMRHFHNYLKEHSAQLDNAEDMDVVPHAHEVMGSMLIFGKWGMPAMPELLVLSRDPKINAKLRVVSLQTWLGFSAFADQDILPVLNSFLLDAATPTPLRQFVVLQLNQHASRASMVLPVLRQEIALLIADNGAHSDSQRTYHQALIPVYARFELPEQAWENLFSLYLKENENEVIEVLRAELRKLLAQYPAYERKLVMAFLDSKDKKNRQSISDLVTDLNDASSLSMLLATLSQPEQQEMVLELIARLDAKLPVVQDYLQAELSKPARAFDIARMIIRMGKPYAEAQDELFKLWQRANDPNAQWVYLRALMVAGPVQPSMRSVLLQRLRADIARVKGLATSQRPVDLGSACMVLKAVISLPAAQEEAYTILRGATHLIKRYPYNDCVQEFATAIAVRHDKPTVKILFGLLLDNQLANKFPIRAALLGMPDQSLDVLPGLLRTAQGLNLMLLEEVLVGIQHPRASVVLNAHAKSKLPGLHVSLQQYIANGVRPQRVKERTVEYNLTIFTEKAQIVWHLLHLSPNDPKTAALMLTQLGSEDEVIANMSSRFLSTYAYNVCEKPELTEQRAAFVQAMTDFLKRSPGDAGAMQLISELTQKCQLK